MPSKESMQEYWEYIKELETSEYHFTELNESELQKIEFSDIAFYKEAEFGAMGEHGGIEFVLHNSKFYHTNSIMREEIFKKFLLKFPQIRKISTFCGYAKNVTSEFVHFYLGFGNHLFVRKEFANFIQKKLPDKAQPIDGWLYNFWKDLALESLKK